MTTKRVLIAALTLAVLAGCAAPDNGAKFLAVNNNAEASTRLARIEKVRYGTMPADTSNTWQAYAGQVVGGVIGGLAANQVHSNAFRPVATGFGAVGGAFVGQQITASAGQVPAVELTYTFDGCKGGDCTKTLVQRLEKDTALAWKVGNLVRVTSANGTRVIPL